MALIKHFQGYITTTTTIYTVPSGKVAKIEGYVSLGNTAYNATDTGGTVSLGEMTLYYSGDYGNGAMLSFRRNGTSLKLMNSPQSTSSATANFRPTTAYYPNSYFSYAGRLQNQTDDEVRKRMKNVEHGPVCYIGASDTISFTPTSSGYCSYQFVAIEEDAS